MKKINYKLIIIILIFIIMLIPIKDHLYDGGSVEYKAILYKITKIHRINSQSSTGYEDGLEIKIFGIKVYSVRNVYVETAKIEVVKKEIQDTNKFNKYLETEERTVYVSSNLEEVYYYHGNSKETLKEHLENYQKTFEDNLKDLTDIMQLIVTYKDGGTKIFKSRKYDITIIKYNTVLGNKDIFIGDYNMEFSDASKDKE